MERTGGRYCAGMSDPHEPPPAPDDVLQVLRNFMAERDWNQFHTPANLAKSIAIESGELLECFQWEETVDRERTLAEVADVLTYAYLLADVLGARPDELILDKLTVTAEKYPVEMAYGRSDKHDRL